MRRSSRGNQLAPWVNSSLSATELDRALKNHIDTIMRHYKGKIYGYDVIVGRSTQASSLNLCDRCSESY